MKTYVEKNALNAADFLGNFLKKEDILEEQVVRLVDVYADELPGENRRKLVARFAEFQRPMVLNATNIKRLVKIFGTGDTTQWRGEVALYVDHNIEFGGKTVGGLRVRSARANGKERARQGERIIYQAEGDEFI